MVAYQLIGTERHTTIAGFSIIIREGVNAFGAMEISYFAATLPGYRQLAIVQAALRDPEDTDTVCGFVTMGFDPTEDDGIGMWIFDVDDHGAEAFARACQKAIDAIRELLPRLISDPVALRYAGFSA